MKRVELTILGCDQRGNISFEEMEMSIRKNTRAIVCTHGSNLTGNMIDIERVGRDRQKVWASFDRRRFTDGRCLSYRCTEDGHRHPVCFTGHKGLLGPQGDRGLYVREGVKVRPLLSGGKRDRYI